VVKQSKDVFLIDFIQRNYTLGEEEKEGRIIEHFCFFRLGVLGF